MNNAFLTLAVNLGLAGKATFHVERKTRHGRWLAKRYAATLAPVSQTATTVALKVR